MDPDRPASSDGSQGPRSTSLAYRWGRAIARYSAVVQPERMYVDGIIPDGTVVWAAWHGQNMLALRAHGLLHRGGFAAFMPPPTLQGRTMQGWLEGTGCVECAALPPDRTGNVAPGLKRMVRSIRAGRDAVVAVDGPGGPALKARPGALWLARLGRVPLVPISFAARPAVRLPRWDKHVVPLPRATVVASIADAVVVDTSDLDAALPDLEAALQRVNRRASALLARVEEGLAAGELRPLPAALRSAGTG